MKRELHLHIYDHWTNDKYINDHLRWMTQTKSRKPPGFVENRDLQTGDDEKLIRGKIPMK